VIDVLILGAIALFVLAQLYKALGRDNGPPENRTRPASPPSARPDADMRPAETRGTVIPMPRNAPADKPSGRPAFTGPAAYGLEEIHNADPSFHPREFVSGAKAAYEMIVGAFASGDTATLKPLLDDEVYAAWSDAIAARANGGPAAPTLVRLRNAEIEEAEMVDGVARIDVEFQAELAEGDRIRGVREVWTFERGVRSPDPNWKLTAVSSPG
jgi:predicted lipid-binding transport protein (Tim44 family)